MKPTSLLFPTIFPSRNHCLSTPLSDLNPAAMFRSVLLQSPHSHYPSHRCQEPCARLLAPLTLWICVSVSLRYGVYGDFRMVLGPSSSRLVKASSVFVERVEVRDQNGNEVLLHGFYQKPELSRESNWSSSNYLIVGSHSRQGFSMWLNKGSRIRMRWETQGSRLENLRVIVVKGERRYQTLLPNLRNSTASFLFREPLYGTEAEYTIEEDDKYYLGIINTSPRSIIMSMTLNVTSKMYDLKKARNMCSTRNGSCVLKLMFPDTKYIVLTTPDNGDINGWYVGLSFVARVVTYIGILGFFIIIIFLLLKYLGACEGESSAMVETSTWEVRERTETDPIWPPKPARLTYGTTAEADEENNDAETGSSSSSEDLYDAKLCVICYDNQRNCFFVPCGHCAICYDCSHRIMDDDNKMCPICRRTIHKVRRLFTP